MKTKGNLSPLLPLGLLPVLLILLLLLLPQCHTYLLQQLLPELREAECFRCCTTIQVVIGGGIPKREGGQGRMGHPAGSRQLERVSWGKPSGHRCHLSAQLMIGGSILYLSSAGGGGDTGQSLSLGAVQRVQLLLVRRAKSPADVEIVW